MKGGAGATSHGLSTYGGINEQHAVGPRDNTIAMKQMNGGKGFVMSPHLFSNNNKSKKKGGRSYFRSNKSKKYKGGRSHYRKRRGGRSSYRKRLTRGGGEPVVNFCYNPQTNDVVAANGDVCPEGFQFVTPEVIKTADAALRTNITNAATATLGQPITGGKKRGGGDWKWCENQYTGRAYPVSMYCNMGDYRI
jgi:ribosomal protein L32E